jgi:5-methylcytosine-specific restriction endonuclease McrA
MAGTARCVNTPQPPNHHPAKDGTMAAKKCSKCGVEKPLDQFHKQKNCKDGLKPECKVCHYLACRARFDPEKHREYNRSYRLKHPNRDREYYEKNKNVILPKQVEYNRRNKEAYNKKIREWRKANPSKVQVWVRNRRAKLNGLVGTHTIEDILALMASQRGKCVYCRIDISKSYQVDHIVPVARGGSNDKGNLQLLCKACNLDKRAKDPLEYQRKRGMLL